MKRFCFAATLLILLTLSGCGGKGAITITPPETARSVIQVYAPEDRYAFYAPRATVPRSWQDVQVRPLIVYASAFVPYDIGASLVSAGLFANGHLLICYPVDQCVSLMKGSPKAILLASRDVRFDESANLVEVRFR